MEQRFLILFTAIVMIFSTATNTYAWNKSYDSTTVYTTNSFAIESATHKISTAFAGVAESNNYDYTLAIAGYFEKELTDGSHIFTKDDINAQTISIVAYNKDNRMRRVLLQSTIEEMSATVYNGKVVEFIMRGYVQTEGGTLDQYTAVMYP